MYTENANDSTKKLLELINEFSKVAGYKIKIQKLLAFYIPVMNYQKGKQRKEPCLQLHPKFGNNPIYLSRMNKL